MNAHTAWLQGEAAADLKNWKQAERQYRLALASDPRHVPALIGLSTALTQRGAHRDARAILAKADGIRCRVYAPAGFVFLNNRD